MSSLLIYKLIPIMKALERIIFTDYNPVFCEKVKEKIGNQLQVHKDYSVKVETVDGDIRSFSIPNAAYVSPANSFMRFDGGIDFYYGKMFPTLQGDAQKHASRYPYSYNALPILPIGAAMVVPVKHPQNNPPNNYMVAAPTMFEPEELTGHKVNYVRWAFLAVMAAIEKYNHWQKDKTKQITTLIVPGLGTGCGDLSYGQSVDLILEATQDFVGRKNMKDEASDDPMLYLCNRGQTKPTFVIEIEKQFKDNHPLNY